MQFQFAFRHFHIAGTVAKTCYACCIANELSSQKAMYMTQFANAFKARSDVGDDSNAPPWAAGRRGGVSSQQKYYPRRGPRGRGFPLQEGWLLAPTPTPEKRCCTSRLASFELRLRCSTRLCQQEAPVNVNVNAKRWS